MYSLTSRKHLTIDPQKAKDLLGCNLFEAQRPISPAHVKRLAKLMTDGLFLDGDIAVAKTLTGKTYLMNGQHTLTAVLDTDSSIHSQLNYYRCETAEDLSLLFRQFDFASKPRNLSEASWVEAYVLNLGWSRPVVSLTVAGAAFLIPKGQIDKTTKVEMLKEWIPEGAFMNRLFSQPARHLTRSSVAAAIIRTHRKDPDAAERFWRDVRDCDNVSKSNAAHTLHEWLIMNWFDTGRGAIQFNDLVYAKCIVAWNAFRQGRPTQLKVYEDKDTLKVA